MGVITHPQEYVQREETIPDVSAESLRKLSKTEEPKTAKLVEETGSKTRREASTERVEVNTASLEMKNREKAVKKKKRVISKQSKDVDELSSEFSTTETIPE